MGFQQREKNKYLVTEGDVTIPEHLKRPAALVMSATSLRVDATPVDLRNVLSALDLLQKTSEE